MCDFSPEHSSGTSWRFSAEIPDYCTVLLIYDALDWKPDKRKKGIPLPRIPFWKSIVSQNPPWENGSFGRWAPRISWCAI